jgi:hypothetical protein
MRRLHKLVRLRFFISSGKAGAASAQGIAAEIPQALPIGNDEELERKARPRVAGMRPKSKNTKQTPPPAAYAKRLFQPIRHGVKVCRRDATA